MPIAYFVSGATYAGKTTLINKLNKVISCQHIDALELAQTKYVEELSSGKQVPFESFPEIIQQVIKTDSVAFRGFIIELQDYIKAEHVREWSKGLNVVHIQLLLSKEDCDYKTRTVLMDPFTGNVYSNGQVAYSLKVLEQKRTEMERNVKAMEEGQEEQEEVEEEAVKEANEDVEDAELKEKVKKRIEFLREIISGKVKWQPLDENVLQRLVQLPSVALQQKSNENVFQGLKVETIQIDATQSPEALFYNLLERLDTLGLIAQSSKQPLPKILTPAETGFKGLPLEEVIRHYNQSNPLAKFPYTLHYNWNTYCPVSSKDTLVQGDPAIASVYKGHIYFFKSQVERNAFDAYPDKYLEFPQPNIKAFFIGDDRQYHQIVGELEKYVAVQKIDIVDILQGLYDSNKLDQTFDQALNRGNCIPTETAFAIVKKHIQLSDSWIITNIQFFPEMAEWLTEANIVPEYMLIGEKDQTTVLLKELEAMQLKIIDVQENAGASVFSLMCAANPFQAKPVNIASGKSAEVNVTEKSNFGDFCPVSLYHGFVKKGLSNFSGKYKGKVYFFASEDLKQRFLTQPETFIRETNIPPTRLSFIGANASGKTTVARAFDLPLIEFEKEVRSMFKAMVRSGELADDPMKFEENNSKPTPAIILQELTKRWILEGFPRTKQDADWIMKQGYHMDCVISFKVDPEIAAHRAFRKQNVGVEYQELVSQIEKQNARVMEIQTTIETMSNVSVYQVDGNVAPNAIIANIRRQSRQFLDARSSIVRHAQAVDSSTTTKLLQEGLVESSVYAKYCPVATSFKLAQFEKMMGFRPVLVNGCIYYLSSAKNQKEFIADPARYLNSRLLYPTVRVGLCVIGAPFSGKTSLAKQISERYDLEYVNVEGALQFMLNSTEDFVLGNKISDLLLSGKKVSDDIVVEVLHCILNRSQCQARGWVLDGFPETQTQAELLHKRGILPHKVLNINGNMDTLNERLLINLSHVNERNFDILSQEFSVYERECAALKNIFDKEFENVVDLTSLMTKWATIEKASKILEESVEAEQNYVLRLKQGRACVIDNVCISKSTILQNLSKFKTFCPVSYVGNHELVNNEWNRAKIVEYNGKYYYVSDTKSIERFVGSPEVYSRGADLPATLPSKLTKTQVKAKFPMAIALDGYCPVSLLNSKGDFSKMKKGSYVFAAEYNSKIFSFATAESLNDFLKKPMLYAEQELPKKIPPPQIAIDINSLPIIGYLEQTTASLLIESLVELKRVKPKHPSLSVAQSAIRFISLWLKANNSKTNSFNRKKYKDELDTFMESCELVMELANQVEQFVLPELRSKGMDAKLLKFDGMLTKRYKQ